MYKDCILFDAHFHIINDRFPLVGNNGYLPKNFTCKDYLKRLKRINLVGGAVISGSFQAYDQSYLEEALRKLGGNYVGVTQLSPMATEAEIKHLDEKGVCGIRFNFKRNCNTEINELMNLACRVYEIANWHVELYIDSDKLSEIYYKVIQLPAVAIDHLGVTKKGFDNIIKLAEKGVRIKASGFGRINFNVVDALHELYSINHMCLMFGTDLPSTRAPRIFDESDIQLVLDNFDKDAADKILYKNAVEFYRI